MKKFFAALVAVAMTVVTAGCGGGGGSTSTGGVYYTHEQLADEFADRLWTDVGIDAELVKVNTLSYDYIVVYDYDYGTYDAYYIGNYNVGESVSNYLNTYNSYFYYDLDYLGDGIYEDWYTGKLFEKVQASPKDRLKLAAIKEGLEVKKVGDKLQNLFGLEATRAQEVAQLTAMWQKLPAERRSTEKADEFAKLALGHTITSYKAAVEKKMAGDDGDFKALVQDTAALNGVLPEQANQILATFGL